MFWSCSVDKIRSKFVYYRVLRYLFVLVLLQFITVTQFSYTEKRPRLRTCLCTRGHRLKYIVTDLRVGCRGAKACDPIDRFRWTNRNIRASGCAKPFRGYVQALKRSSHTFSHLLFIIFPNLTKMYIFRADVLWFRQHVTQPLPWTHAQKHFHESIYKRTNTLAGKTFSYNLVGKFMFSQFSHIFSVVRAIALVLVWQFNE